MTLRFCDRTLLGPFLAIISYLCVTYFWYAPFYSLLHLTPLPYSQGGNKSFFPLFLPFFRFPLPPPLIFDSPFLTESNMPRGIRQISKVLLSCSETNKFGRCFVMLKRKPWEVQRQQFARSLAWRTSKADALERGAREPDQASLPPPPPTTIACLGLGPW